MKMKINGITNELSFYIGKGSSDISMFRGNFDIKERTEKRIPAPESLAISVEEKDGLIFIKGRCEDKSYNRAWIRISADGEEHVTGGGEQFSYLDLRGKKFPIWTREQGVGRNKRTLVTKLADVEKSGGDYHTTFFPQATFMSSRMYFAHLENYEYSVLDFTHKEYHEISVWSANFDLVIGTGKSYRELTEKLTGLLGRQPMLPDWAIRGIWLGVQGGTETVLNIAEKCRNGGIEMPAIWIQDWEGKRITSFGKRLQWDWRWNSELYPNLPEIIAGDRESRWMAYINPYLVEGGVLFNEAKEKSYFVKNSSGEDYLFDFGEYDCGVVDLTMPEAFEWYKNVIKKNIIGLGFRGWMADFGEYLPADAVCFGGTGLEKHNEWPVLWAKCNREAVEESGLLGDCVFFMRSGGAGSGRYSTLAWAGDQNVDWSVDDGIPSVITSALTLGMSGFGLQCSDCGGYTTLFHLHRTEELMQRWLEFACFTPVMRTHEGNRPDSNIQMYSNEKMIACAAKFSKIHSALAPYIKECMKTNTENGTPVMRPLFFEEPENDALYSRDLFSYMLGDDLAVAPVVKKGAKTRKGILPKGEWIHLWSGKEFHGGEFEVKAPVGEIPVFFKKNSEFAGLFLSIITNFNL